MYEYVCSRFVLRAARAALAVVGQAIKRLPTAGFRSLPDTTYDTWRVCNPFRTLDVDKQALTRLAIAGVRIIGRIEGCLDTTNEAVWCVRHPFVFRAIRRALAGAKQVLKRFSIAGVQIIGRRDV